MFQKNANNHTDVGLLCMAAYNSMAILAVKDKRPGAKKHEIYGMLQKSFDHALAGIMNKAEASVPMRIVAPDPSQLKTV